MDIPILNLINFEKLPNVRCRYVLTSPRSLRACKEANIKPIELLYKSPEEFAKEFGHKVGFDFLFREYEKERLRKLEICRAIRKKLVLSKNGQKDERYEALLCENTGQNETQGKWSQIFLPPIEDLRGTPATTPVNEFIEDEIRSPKPEKDDSGFKLDKINMTAIDSDLFKSKFRKKRSNKIYDEQCSRVPSRSKSRGSNKIPKIGSAIRSNHKAKDFKENLLEPDYSVHKFQKVIENSVLRDLRHQRAELVQKELEQGLEKWQDDVMVTQWVATLRAEEQAIRELEARTQRLHEKNKIRQILHKHNLNKVKEMEDYKVENLRKQVQYKDLKISVLHNEREKVICESRNRAHSVAELRQQIRDLVTPETFNQKLMKYNLGRRVYSTPVVCPTFIQSSHIRLG